MKYILFLALWLSLSLSATAACSPAVYAVCRIQLLDGSWKEGIINISGYACSGIWMNGFRIENADVATNQFFSLDLRKLSFSPGRAITVVTSDGKQATKIELSKTAKIFYLNWALEEEIRKKEPARAAKMLLLKGQHEEHSYEKLDSLTIYTGLSRFLHLPDTPAEIKRMQIKIPLNKIVSLELLKNPSRRWTSYFRQRRKVNPCYIKDGCEDYQEPAWYHEAQANKETYNYLKQEIEGTMPKTK